MKRRNPYPGLSLTVDRHGKRRWRFRQKGKPSGYIPPDLEYGSADFIAAYERLATGVIEIGAHLHRSDQGSLEWLTEVYRRTPDWHRLSPITHKRLNAEIKRLNADHGGRLISDLRRAHVEALMTRKAQGGDRYTPSGANMLLKLIRRLCRFAVERGYLERDPTKGIRFLPTNPDGFHTWTDAEITRFESYHGIMSKAVLAQRLILCTGAARQDVTRMGWQNISAGKIEYRRGKTGGEISLPILGELAEVLDQVPREQLLFLTHGADARGYTAETFGNWFRDQCVAAGLPHCSSHGLRKAGATRLANVGCSEFEIMAFLGHKTPAEARTYTRKASRKILGASAMQKLENLSNPVTRLDNKTRKHLKSKRK